MINIPSTVNDPLHRYKMPKMSLKVEGKGNGIMTNVTNLDEVAKALRVPPTYPLKFFGIELGSLTKVKPASFIVNGKHDITTMEKTLDKFIEKYILCPQCKLPEMTLKAKKDTLLGSCRSCGKISKLDNVHKLATYIIKNPPKDDSEFAGDKHKSKHKHKEKEKAEPKVKSVKEHLKEVPEKERKVGEEMKMMEEVTSLTGPEVVESIKRINDFKNAQKRSASELVDQISNICISQGLKDDLKYYVTIHGLFDENFLFQWAEDQSSKDAIKIMVENEEKGQYWVLLALQRFILKTHPTALAQHINTIVKCFYDIDILKEAVIIKCYGDEDGTKVLSKGKSFNAELNKQFKKEIQPFVKWLQEAEEDESGSEEETVEEEKEDENTRRQKQLIAEQKRLQELRLQETKEEATKAEEEQKAEGAQPLNVLGIKTESEAASLDDL